MKKIMLSAGEVSGDIHGAYLVKEIKRLCPDIYFFGMGSEKLLSEGVDIKLDITKRGTIGIFEALPNIFPLYASYLQMVSLLKKERPDLLILIDSQGFNLPLANAARKLGVKTVYFIAPQEWLWGTPRGVKKVAHTIDLIVAIFQKEYDSYKEVGANVVYFGHPLLDIIKPSLDRVSARKYFVGNNVGDSPVIALCPGSRIQEIRGLLPIFLDSCKIISQSFPSANFLIPAASINMIKEIFGLISDFRPKAVVGHTYDILNASDLAICASGTINLEASILGIPNIMVYKLSPLTYFIGKYLLKVGDKLPFFSMPNILLNKPAIPEFIMQQATPQNISSFSLKVLFDSSLQNNMKEHFSHLRTLLGSPGAISCIASSILDFAKF